MAIAASGLALVLFALVHLAGLGLAWWNPAAFEQYAASLHQAPWLPVVEVGLLLLMLIHPAQAILQTLANRAACGAAAAQRRSRRVGDLEPLAALAGRLMPWSGALLLVFLAVHLAQLRLRRPPTGLELDTLLAVLRQPHWLALYGLAGGALALHLLHGHESAHRRLGLLDPRNALAIRRAGRGLALVIGAGFALLPLVLLWGSRP